MVFSVCVHQCTKINLNETPGNWRGKYFVCDIFLSTFNGIELQNLSPQHSCKINLILSMLNTKYHTQPYQCIQNIQQITLSLAGIHTHKRRCFETFLCVILLLATVCLCASLKRLSSALRAQKNL